MGGITHDDPGTVNRARVKTGLAAVTFLVFAVISYSNFQTVTVQTMPKMQMVQTTQVAQISLTIRVQLAATFSFYSESAKHTVQIGLVPMYPFPTGGNSSVELVTSICGLSPSGFWPSFVSFRSSAAGCPAEGTYLIQFTGNNTFPTLDLAGFFDTTSFLWRTPAEIPSVRVKTGFSVFGVLLVLPPSQSRILSIFSESNSTLEVSTASVAGTNGVVVTGFIASSNVVVIYEPNWWEPISIAVIAASVALVTLFALFRRRLVSNKMGSLFGRLRHVLKAFRYHSTQILVLLLVVSSLMISVSVLVGPDPRPRVYALTVSDISQVERTVSGMGGITVTPADQVPTKLDSLTSIGSVDLVLVGDFPYPGPQDDRLFTAISLAPRVVIIHDLADPSFEGELQRRFPDKAAVIPDVSFLAEQVASVRKRSNILGLHDPNTFVLGSELVGVSSFVLVFFGMAYLPMRLLEVKDRHRATGFAEAIATSVVVFTLSETVYVASSALLQVPIGLHAGTLGSSATAIGFLGFGGGSRPRAAAGLLGFLFGGLADKDNPVRINPTGMISFAFALLLVVVDPLTGGLLFYQVFLFFATSGPTLQFAQNTVLVFKAYLSTIGFSFAAFVSPVYVISTGAILYYAFAIPFSQYNKLRPATGTFLFLASAFGASDGFIRIANADPWQIITTIFPGVATGFLIVLVFAAASLVEQLLESLTRKTFR